MLALLSPLRKATRAIAMLGLIGMLAACGGSVGDGPIFNTRSSVQVALLVPQGSEDPQIALVARDLENAARLAANDLEGVDVQITVYDTAGSATQAATAAQTAARDGADVILGPLFAPAAAAAGFAVQNRNLNVLTFSNNPTVAGNNVFILGRTFDSITSRLVRYANTRGRGNIFVVHGNGTAEISGRDSIMRAAAISGAQIAGVESFELSQQGVIDAIPRISEGIEQSNATSLFVTSSTDGALPFLAELLPENGVDFEQVQLIALGRLDVPASALSLGGLQGAWFALPDPAVTRQFGARFAAAYGYDPQPVSGLAYDGVAAIGALAASGQANGFSAAALTQPAGFAGSQGLFRFLPDGTNERSLAVMQVENNQVILIDPAPGFGTSGF